MMRQDAWAFNVIVDQSKPEQMLMMVDRNDANDAIRSSGAKVRLALSFPYLSLSLVCFEHVPTHARVRRRFSCETVTKSESRGSLSVSFRDKAMETCATDSSFTITVSSCSSTIGTWKI
jgi:hypothetical protein